MASLAKTRTRLTQTNPAAVRAGCAKSWSKNWSMTGRGAAHSRVLLATNHSPLVTAFLIHRSAIRNRLNAPVCNHLNFSNRRYRGYSARRVLEENRQRRTADPSSPAAADSVGMTIGMTRRWEFRTPVECIVLQLRPGRTERGLHGPEMTGGGGFVLLLLRGSRHASGCRSRFGLQRKLVT
jgi:hypothetical protein